MESRPTGITPRVILQVVLFVVVIPLLPILISGRWGWVQAWAYGLVVILGFVLSRVLAARRNPDLITERARFMSQKDAKPWDKILAPLLGLGGNLLLLVVGFEERWAPSLVYGRFGWVAGLVLLLVGFAFSSWALVENRFFSGVVRIQTERGHHVISSGPYALIRHPGYAGALLAYVGTLLLLDSLWGIVPVAVYAVATVLRTALEDRTLQEELPGYREYAQKVRYRLVPGIW